MAEKSRYEEAGVNLDEAAKTVGKIKEIVKKTFNSKVLTDLGAFAAAYDARFENLKNPVLVTSTDGVGTKIVLHLEAGTFAEAGQDLVAMCSNDILTMAAKPLFFLDYIAGGKLDSGVVERLVEGIASACLKIGASLIGGETAEMPGLYKEGDYDVSGFIVGVCERDHIPDVSSVKPGDILIGVESSGPHSNGYSLIRKIMEEKSISLQTVISDTGLSFGEMILKPTHLYHPVIMPLFEERLVKTAANITGGGFFENIPRSMPSNVNAVISKSSFVVPEIFKFIMSAGEVEESEMYAVFNMGIGFVLFGERNKETEIHRAIALRGLKSYTIGEVVEGKGKVILVD